MAVSGAKFVRVNATADGANTIVAAQANKRYRILGFVLTTTAAGVIDVRSGTTVLAQFQLPIAGLSTYMGGVDAPAFETGINEAININNPASVDTLGFLTYIEVPTTY